MLYQISFLRSDNWLTIQTNFLVEKEDILHVCIGIGHGIFFK